MQVRLPPERVKTPVKPSNRTLLPDAVLRSPADRERRRIVRRSTAPDTLTTVPRRPSPRRGTDFPSDRDRARVSKRRDDRRAAYGQSREPLRNPPPRSNGSTDHDRARPAIRSDRSPRGDPRVHSPGGVPRRIRTDGLDRGPYRPFDRALRGGGRVDRRRRRRESGRRGGRLRTRDRLRRLLERRRPAPDRVHTGYGRHAPRRVRRGRRVDPAPPVSGRRLGVPVLRAVRRSGVSDHHHPHEIGFESNAGAAGLTEFETTSFRARLQLLG